jgi:hypothetical protein
VRGREDVSEVVLGAFETVIGRRLGPASALSDMPLGKHGLELDSIAIVEGLLICEESTGTPIGTLVERDRLTFGAVVEHFAHE